MAISTAPSPTRRLPADERRAQVLREASRLFGSHGFSGTTTRDIAAAVGITEAALYRYYPSKEAMYAAILDERAASSDLLEAIEPAARAGDDRAVFSGIALTLLRSVEADPSVLRLILYSALEGHELSAPFQEKRIQRLREFLSTYIEGRAREGAFRAIDPVLTARAFMSMLVGQLIGRHVFGHREPSAQSPEQIAEIFVSIFLDGIRAQTATPRRSRRG
jgi:AcrR family transcriptional regulator